MIVNETTLPKRPNDTEINNYRAYKKKRNAPVCQKEI